MEDRITSRRETAVLGALGAILLITAGWWALALWPLPDQAPTWVVRARLLCFGRTPSGLPEPSGWLLLIGQPVGMLGFLIIVWGSSLRDGLRLLRQRTAGRALLVTSSVAVLLGLGAATWRVADAQAPAGSDVLATPLPPEAYDRLDRAAPPLTLVDQNGVTRSLDALRGQVVLVTFAYGHCEDICPLIVRDVLAAKRKIATERSVVAVVVTLDPWRDTPSRLKHIAMQWGLETDEWVLSGAVSEVEAILDEWEVARSRSPQTGDLIHPNLTYLVDADGKIAFAATGGTELITDLAGRL